MDMPLVFIFVFIQKIINMHIDYIIVN